MTREVYHVNNDKQPRNWISSQKQAKSDTETEKKNYLT